MKILLAFCVLAMLAACGVETATTAATSAEIKRREMEQAKKTLDQAKQKIEQSTQQIQQRVEQTGSADKQ